MARFMHTCRPILYHPSAKYNKSVRLNRILLTMKTVQYEKKVETDANLFFLYNFLFQTTHIQIHVHTHILK